MKTPLQTMLIPFGAIGTNAGKLLNLKGATLLGERVYTQRDEFLHKETDDYRYYKKGDKFFSVHDKYGKGAVATAFRTSCYEVTKESMMDTLFGLGFSRDEVERKIGSTIEVI